MKEDMIMSGIFAEKMKKEKTETDKNRFLWIQHVQRVVYFSPMEGFEKKEFRSQGELMDYTKACVSAGYYIG